jgi:small-conductance mechanosensitive channel
MRGFGDSSLDFELLGWVEKPVLRGKVLHEMLMTIYKRFAAEGVEIPFPQRDLHLRSAVPQLTRTSDD